MVEHGFGQQAWRVIENNVRPRFVARLGTRQLVEADEPQLRVLEATAVPAPIPAHCDENHAFSTVTHGRRAARNGLSDSGLGDEHRSSEKKPSSQSQLLSCFNER